MVYPITAMLLGTGGRVKCNWKALGEYVRKESTAAWYMTLLWLNRLGMCSRAKSSCFHLSKAVKATFLQAKPRGAAAHM